METLTIETQVSEVEKAHAALTTTQIATQKQAQAVGLLRGQLESHQEFLVKLEQRYDRECAAEQSDKARETLGQIQDAKGLVRGAELRLADGEQKLAALRAAEAPLLSEFQRLSREAEIATERTDVDGLVAQLGEQLETFTNAENSLRAAIASMRSRQFISDGNKSVAFGAAFETEREVQKRRHNGRIQL